MADRLSLQDFADVNPESLGFSTAASFEFRYIDLASVSNGRIDWAATSVQQFGSSPSRARRLLRDGDVLFGTVRPALRSHAALRSSPSVCVASTGFAVVRARDGVSDSRFLAHFLLSDICAGEARRVEVGSSYPAVNENDVRRLAVPRFALVEQQRIAEVLDAIDSVIAASELVAAKQDRLALALLEQVWSAASGHPRATVADVVDGPSGAVIGPFGSDLVATDYREYGVPVVFVQDVVAGESVRHRSGIFVSTAKAKALHAHAIRPGDLAVTKMGLPPGIAAVYPKGLPPGIVTADIIRLRPNRRVVRSDWLVSSINGPAARAQVRAVTGGVTRPKITLRDFRLLALNVPPIELQEELLRPVAHAKELARLEGERLRKLRLLRTGLADDLLAGRVRTDSV